jgi:hypothetical protein
MLFKSSDASSIPVLFFSKLEFSKDTICSSIEFSDIASKSLCFDIFPHLSVGNVTCYKSNGASTVDYALADVDLLKNINFFQVSDPSYLLDHVQIAKA